MKRDGFASAILFIVLALAVIGGIAYCYFEQSPPIVAHNSFAEPSSTAAVPPSLLSATSTTTSHTEIACSANNMNCFIDAARTCSPATVESAQTLSLFNVFNKTVQTRLALTGLSSSRKCSFVDHVDAVNLSLTAQAEQEAQSQGSTNAQIQQELETETAQARQRTLGMTISCEMTTSTLVDMLLRWSEQELSASDLPSSNCAATQADGAKATLSAGGSIPIITTGQQPSQPQAASNGAFPDDATPTTAPPSGVGTMTQSLTSGEDSTANELEFKVNAITASQVNMTVTDTITGQIQTVAFTVNDPLMLLGHDMEIVAIQQVSYGTVNGQPLYGEDATLRYK